MIAVFERDKSRTV